MSKIPLSLNSGDAQAQFNAAPAGAAQQQAVAPTTPVMGYCAVGFGLLGIFTIGFVFMPLGLIFSIAALFLGQSVWGVVGLMLAVAGFITSPKLWLIVGMGALYVMFDFDEFMKPALDFLRSIGISDYTTEV